MKNTYDIVGKTYDIVGFRLVLATLTYDITYAIVYDIVGQTYDIVCDFIRNLRYCRPLGRLLPIVPYDVAYDIVDFFRNRIRYLRVTLVLYDIVGDIRNRRSISVLTFD